MASGQANRFGDANLNARTNFEEIDFKQIEAERLRATGQYVGQQPISSTGYVHQPIIFKEFTEESLARIKRRRDSRSRARQSTCNNEDRARLEPDPYLISGSQLPPAIIRQMPSELAGRPIEDIDPYYEDKETFVIISRSKELIRFSAKPSLYLLGPLNPIRRIVLRILVSSIFNLLVIMTILVNCVLMTMQSDTVEKTEVIFTTIYTTEFILRVLARGFIVDKFTYLHDMWNILDFVVIIMAYMTILMQESLGNLSVIRSFRVLRALKTVAIIPGMKTIVGAVIDSVKNLKDVVVLTLFSLTVFSLLGLQIYQGVLTQKCILNGPSDMGDVEWFEWNSNSSYWVIDDSSEIHGAYRLCGNASGAQTCPPDHTCLQGFGPNPDHGYTNFDTFGWSLICSFRLMTQDFWEGLYMQVLKTAGSWHIFFFIFSIFLGSIYLMNLILAIVAMSYNDLQRRAEEEEEAAAEDEAAFLESCRIAEMQTNMSQCSGTPDVGTSYRPSVEIGLVGQTILAGLCQQMMLPINGRPSATSRSHSLCVDFENSNLKRPGHFPNYYDPMAGAASMTELRRKSSIRTNESSATPDSGSRTGSLVGQRRLLPNIGIKGNRLDRHRDGARLRPISRRSPHHLSLVSNNERFEDKARHRSSTASVDLQALRQRAVIIDNGMRRVSQQSTSYPTGTSFDGVDSSQLLASDSQDPNLSLEQHATTQPSTSRRRRSVKGTVSLFAHSARGTSSIDSQPIQQPCAYKYSSETAICEQPSHVHPHGRTVVQKRLHPIDAMTQPREQRQLQSLPQQQQHPTNLRSSLRRRSSTQRRSSGSCRRCSTLSNVEQSTFLRFPPGPKTIQRQQQLQAQNLNLSVMPGSGSGAVDHANLALNPSLPLTSKSCSMRTLQSTTSNQNSPSGVSLKSAGGIPSACGKQLGNDDYLRADRNMHHLSVENFQQFGAMRPGGALGSVSSARARQQSLVPGSSGGATASQDSQATAMTNPTDLDTCKTASALSVSACGNGGGGGGGGGGGSRKQSLGQRGRLSSRQLHIHPSTMAANFSISSRLRQQSMYAGSSQAPSLDHQRYLAYQHNQFQMQQAQQRQPSSAALSGVRRLSRDFVRQADEWSRVSVGANVDLRRLLRLWVHTNPKSELRGDAQRPSIGSCSIFSQTNQSYRLNIESPHQQQQQQFINKHGGNNAGPGAASAFNSPRPSAANSQAWQAYEVLSAVSRRNRFMSNANAFGAALPLDDNLADSVSINGRDKCVAYCLSCLDMLCIWECCAPIQRLIALLVFDPFTELFIILCILVNTLFMALDSDDADEQLRKLFEKGNYFFTATFAVEALMKIIALSPKFYFSHGWNVFDAIIVALSLLELGLEGVYGLSVLRSFRLLRVFKLAKSWPTLNLLISIMGKAVGDLGNLTFVLSIIVFIFAVMGMQLFGNKYEAKNFPSKELPRWNFTDFMHSFMIVFRVLCAEFIEPMWDCLLVAGWPCIPFFLIAVTVGNLVVLNLFLALLLASFGASNLSSPQADNVDTKKLREATDRFKRFGRFVRRRLSRAVSGLTSCLLRRNHAASGGLEGPAGCGHDDAGRVKSRIVTMSRKERLQNIERRTEELKSKIKRSPEQHHHLRQLAKSQLAASNEAAALYHPPGSFNFGYDKHKSAHQQAASAMRRVQMPAIPIIVNEPSEGNEESATITHNDLESSNYDHQGAGPCGHSMEGTSATHASQEHPDERSGDPTTGGAAGLAEETSSLNSDISLNISDLSSTHENSPQPTVAPLVRPGLPICQQSDTATANAPTGAPFGATAMAMHTIREDSRDESSCVSPTPTEESMRAIKSAGAGGASCAPRREHRDGRSSVDNKQTSCGEHDQAGAQASGQAVYGREGAKGGDAQQNEPLLGKLARHNADQHASHMLDVGDHAYSAKGTSSDGAAEEERPKSSLYLQAPRRQQMEEEDEQTLQHIESYIEKCMCVGIICLKWFLFRQWVRKIVEHRYFDQCILILIIISSGTLALEDRHLDEKPTLKRTLDILDTLFTVLFSLEMIFKWISFGLRRYFGSGFWSWLDFVIVMVSLVNLMASVFGSGKIQALKTMRTLRAMRGLRPLRALQRFQGMRVVVNALIQAIPSIFNVLLVCLIFWLIFSIMGVQAFGGKFWRCLSPETRELVSYEVAANKFECLERNLTWANPQINFDNVLNAYLALFQVATFKGWLEIMDSATDSRLRDEQPVREANIYMYFYFVFFVIFGSFFTLNLFIGVIIDNFNEQKKKTGGSLEMFMTDDQKKYYHAMKKMRSKKPQRAMTRPKFKPQAFMFDVVTSKKFDLAIMIIIGLNMLVMALEHYGQSPEFTQTLENLNLLFIAIFTLECLIKMFALRHFYFREWWNVFDFTVVTLSILGVLMKEYVAKYFVSPTLLRVVRVVKVGRVLRLVKGAKGIRCLLFALAMSLPALFNICLLLFLVMFIYAIFGMNLFGHVRHRSGIDDTFNFETFPSSIMVLFQMATSAGWDLVLDPLMDEENDCQKPDPAQGIEGTCGNRTLAIIYLVSYVIVAFLIIINMYIAVILENYSQATEDVQEGLTDDDYEMYYEIWQKFDPEGTQYLPHSKLSDFVDALEDPLRIAKPNELAIVVMDINIYEGDRCYCVDILDALTKYFFTRKGLNISVTEELRQVQSTLHETPFERITTTYQLKRQDYSARVIQGAWRKWRARALASREERGSRTLPAGGTSPGVGRRAQTRATNLMSATATGAAALEAGASVSAATRFQDVVSAKLLEYKNQICKSER